LNVCKKEMLSAAKILTTEDILDLTIEELKEKFELHEVKGLSKPQLQNALIKALLPSGLTRLKEEWILRSKTLEAQTVVEKQFRRVGDRSFEVEINC